MVVQGWCGMINIDNINYGWADLHLGHCVFSVSYLSCLKQELDYIFNLNTEASTSGANQTILEGESEGDLCLVTYLTFGNLGMFDIKKDGEYGNILNIVWQRVNSNEDSNITFLRFPYEDFMEEYRQLTEDIKENYIRNFVCVQDEEEYEEYSSIY